MTKSTKSSQHEFQAEVKQVLDIVINSLYSSPEIFLRELISNSADALDKVRFLAVTNPDILGAEKDLEIQLVPDRENQALSLIDTGVGMTREDLIENLGTIAHSGSKRFLETAAKAKKAEGDAAVELIGQFGVGFYSSFLVAKRVEVRTLAAEGGKGLKWTSEVTGGYSIEECPEWTTRGTEVRLFLKDDQIEFLDEHRIRNLVTRYSDFVSWPILLEVEREEGGDDDKKTVKKDERINNANAIWRRPKRDVTDEEYEEFYKHISHDFEPPLDTLHFSIEGSTAYTGLLFLPREAPYDLYDRDRPRGVRLYVKRVMIMESCEELIPEYLRFVRGVIDSEDLPLNVSRESLQENRIVKTIRGTVTSRVLSALEYMAKENVEDYVLFWKNFGKVMKEGLHFDLENREKLTELVRFDSSAHAMTSLKDYVARMPEDQEQIYYAIASSRAAVESSPHLEGLKARGYEVLFMTDPIDEWAVMGIPEYDGKNLVSAMKADLPVKDEDKAENKEAEEKLKDLTDRCQEVLDSTVSEVRLSGRLTDSPSCLVVPEGGVHAHIERMLRAQGQDVPAQKRILELNPKHPVVERLHALHESGAGTDQVNEWIQLLHDQALLAEGSPIPDGSGLAKRMTRLMGQALEAEEVGDVEEAGEASDAERSENPEEAEESN